MPYQFISAHHNHHTSVHGGLHKRLWFLPPWLTHRHTVRQLLTVILLAQPAELKTWNAYRRAPRHWGRYTWPCHSSKWLIESLSVRNRRRNSREHLHQTSSYHNLALSLYSTTIHVIISQNQIVQIIVQIIIIIHSFMFLKRQRYQVIHFAHKTYAVDYNFVLLRTVFGFIFLN